MHLQLLGCFRFFLDASVVEVPALSAKVLAYLGVRRCETERAVVAETLWPEVGRARSLGNLRSALWRLPGCSRAAVKETGSRIYLHPDVSCDIDSLTENPSPGTVDFNDVVALGWCEELLPGWYDDWV